jgi:hypothetical protein
MSMDDSIRNVNCEDRLRAVSQKAALLATTEGQCESGYAQLGWMILEVAELQLWRVRHETFRDYLQSVALVSKKSAGQLHQYFLTIRDLSDTFTIAQIEKMGITKAIQLRNAKDYALVLPQAVINAALDSTITVKGLRKVISVELKMPEEEGDWMDLECEFMVTAEQRALFEQAIDVAIHTEPLTKSTISKSAQMLDVMTKFAMEFLGAHSGDGQ